ncbi:AP-1 complex subunit gamma-2-like isoform X2 [Phaseolus vulgaris]|uniref:AP-1 complex subunit gamma-2-like isoform X2 n=1 Tax=Phaseolus vulgaris TaxID=3885 RepID=UPI0035C9B8D6
MNAFSSPTRLRDMIRAIRACKTAAEERAVVRKECAAIRTSINENDQHYRHRNLAKLMFIHILGYPTYFGQMECLTLIASPGFPEKRMGYLGLMLLLDEKQEVLMLVTNSLKQDLNHTNQYIVGLALCALGNIYVYITEMARDLAQEVERLLDFRDPNIRKKAALCSARIIKKVPDLAENFVGPATALLREKHHGVLITGVQLCTDLCKISSEALEHVRKKCMDGLVRALKDLANNAYSPEYDVGGFTDPFLHIRLLRLLRVLGEGDADASDSMNDILAQVATKIESNKIIGNAILYECVQTIMSVQDTGGLRVLAINILGKFLSHRDNNIRYVGLNMLIKAITVDAQAVQRHRATILECIKDSDASIRKRALELVCILVNETNVKALTMVLVDYLEVSDPDFRVDLTEKICSIVSKYSSEKIWYIDQMLKVLSEAGNFVKDEVWHALIVVISNASELHGYTVRALYQAFQRSAEQETLVRVAVWCIGEYGDFLINNVGMLDVEDPITVTESDVVRVVEIALKRHSSDLTTKAMALVSLLKLSSRFPSRSEPTLVDRIPVLDEATFIARRAGSLPDAASTRTNGVAKAVSPIVDLLDINSDDAPVPSSSGGDLLHDLLGVDLSLPSQQSDASQASKNGPDVLLDLLCIGSPSAPTELPAQRNSSEMDILSPKPSKKAPVSPLDDLASLSLSSRATLNAGAAPLMDSLDGFAPSPPTEENNELVYPSITAFESGSLRLVFNFSKQPGNLQTTNIQATFTNLTSNVYTDFVFQAAVPKFLQLHLDPASGNILTASGKESIKQNMRLTNCQHGKKPLVMRIKVAYKINGKETLEEGQISNFPREL